MQDLENLVFKVKTLLPVVKGISQRDGQAWQRRDVVLEAEENVVYPDVLVATLHGSMIEKFTLQEGDRLQVSLHYGVRQWQDRWFNDIRIIKFERV